GATAGLVLGADDNNERVVADGTHVYVAYRAGALAVIDPTSRTRVADIELKAHPESFQLDRRANRIFVNDPANQAIVVIDLAAGKPMANWSTGSGTNFPMALNDRAGHVVVAFRNPANLG